jgi:hypothetical protein
MKITMYELLGMIKDGKTPKKIKYDNDIWEYIEEKENYINSNGASLNWDYVALYCLKESVEILEEEKKIPEKLGYQDNADGTFYLNHKKYNSEPIKILSKKVNEIIDYLDYLKSKGE